MEEQWKKIVEEVYSETKKLLEQFKKENCKFENLFFEFDSEMYAITAQDQMGGEVLEGIYSEALAAFASSSIESGDYQGVEDKLHEELPKAYKRLLEEKQFDTLAKDTLTITFSTHDGGLSEIGEVVAAGA